MKNYTFINSDYSCCLHYKLNFITKIIDFSVFSLEMENCFSYSFSNCLSFSFKSLQSFKVISSYLKFGLIFDY